MKPEVAAYLDSLALPEPIRERVASIAAGFAFLLAGSEIERLYLATVRDQDRIEYSSLWGFAGDYWLEARDFLRVDDFDVSVYGQSINYIGITSEGITFPNGVSEASRLLVEVGTAKVNYSTLTAVGVACAELLDIVNGLLLPNLVQALPVGVGLADE